MASCKIPADYFMHKGIIILTKADNKETAISQVIKFMDNYGDGDVWDWWVIGGRWQNSLAPKEQSEKWHEQANKLLERKDGEFGISQIKIDANQNALQGAWHDLGLKGTNPYSNHYKMPSEGNAYDVIPLSECLETVKNWIKDTGKESAELFDKVKAERQKELSGESKNSMSGYYAGLYKATVNGDFSFECNVYDCTNDTAEKIPENIEEYYAVMCDLHN